MLEAFTAVVLSWVMAALIIAAVVSTILSWGLLLLAVLRLVIREWANER